jgi:hypothetical protein
MEQCQEKVDRLSERITTAFTLAVDRDPPVGVSRAWNAVVNPFSHFSFGWNNTLFGVVAYHVLDDDERTEFMNWAKRVGQMPDRDSIALRRIQSALSKRQDPADGFIDAVVAWDNLFGSRGGEVTFRISMAMACLLSDRPKIRLELQKEIQELYRFRSDVVHGSTELKYQDVIKYRDRSLVLILQCLRKILKNYPCLLQKKDRSKLIIAGDL